MGVQRVRRQRGGDPRLARAVAHAFHVAGVRRAVAPQHAVRGGEAVAIGHPQCRQRSGVERDVGADDVVEIQHVRGERIDLVAGQRLRRRQRHRAADVVEQRGRVVELAAGGAHGLRCPRASRRRPRAADSCSIRRKCHGSSRTWRRRSPGPRARCRGRAAGRGRRGARRCPSRRSRRASRACRSRRRRALPAASARRVPPPPRRSTTRSPSCGSMARGAWQRAVPAGPDVGSQRDRAACASDGRYPAAPARQATCTLLTRPSASTRHVWIALL